MDYSEAKGQSPNVLFFRMIRLGGMDTLCFDGDGFATKARHCRVLVASPVRVDSPWFADLSGSQEKNSSIMRPPGGTRTLKRAGMRLLGSVLAASGCLAKSRSCGN
jgi:hypothetical protein